MRTEFIKSINCCSPLRREAAANFCNAMAALTMAGLTEVDPDLTRYPDDPLVAQLVRMLNYVVKDLYPDEACATQWLLAELAIRDTLVSWRLGAGVKIGYFPVAEPACLGYQAVTLSAKYFLNGQWCTSIEIYDAITGLPCAGANRPMTVPLAEVAVRLS